MHPPNWALCLYFVGAGNFSVDVYLVRCCTVPSIFPLGLLHTQEGCFLFLGGSQTDGCLQKRYPDGLQITLWTRLWSSRPTCLSHSTFSVHLCDGNTTHTGDFNRRCGHICNSNSSDYIRNTILIEIKENTEVYWQHWIIWRWALYLIASGRKYGVALISSHILVLNFYWYFLAGVSMVWNFHASPLCLNSVVCLAYISVLGSIPPATLELGPSCGEVFLDVETESHIECLYSLSGAWCLCSFQAHPHSDVLLSPRFSDLWERCIRSSFCILRVHFGTLQKRKKCLSSFAKCISHGVVTNKISLQFPKSIPLL